MEIDELTAYCGLKCGTCPIYLATRVTDQEEQAKMRVQIAEFASEHYDMNLQPEDVDDCDGCRAESGRLFSGCSRCEIRNCAQEKDSTTCAHCPQYACVTLEKFFVNDPSARDRLEEIKAGI